MKKKHNTTPFLGILLKKIAPKIGAKVIVEPRWNVVGQITFKNGEKKYFRNSSLDLNPLGSSEISRDKDYANFFMARMGYPIIPQSRTFYSTDWAKIISSPNNIDGAYNYAKKIGLPVIVKPNSGSQGSGVALIHDKKQFYRAMKLIFKQDKVALVQKPVYGRDYRVVVLDNKIISAYERIALNIIGDGVSTIKDLLEKKQKQFISNGRDTKIKTTDPRITEKLKNQRLNLFSIPIKNKQIFLLDNANLSTGGDSLDVTNTIHPEFCRIAIKLTKDMGLRLCGVDLIINGDINHAPKKYWILEINSAPGLDHYVKMGQAQKKIVENLYLQVLKSLEK